MSSKSSSSLQLPAGAPVAAEYDVMVFGGGSAGCTAAIQAARCGMRTALVEKNGVLGGTTVVASVNFPGLFHAWGKQIIRGIGWEFIERTVALGGAELPDFSQTPDRHWHQQIRVNRFIYSTVLDQMCIEAGVDVRLHEMPAGVVDEAGEIHVALTGKEGLQWFKVNKLIDATGDANIAGMMNYPRKKGEVLQPGTLMNQIGGYDISQVNALTDRNQLEELYQQGRRNGEFVLNQRQDSAWLYQALEKGEFHIHVQHIDASSSQSKAAAEIKARQMLMEAVQFLRKLPGCRDLEVRYAAHECGIRETWRIDGEKEVDQHSYVTGYVWPDAICYSFYPIDLHHHQENRIVQTFLEPGVVATLPYGALIPKGSDHLLAAGRCIAGDRMANSAYRVQATCMATGQAAGAAAALAAEGNISVRDVPLAALRGKLTEHGAIVP